MLYHANKVSHLSNVCRSVERERVKSRDRERERERDRHRRSYTRSRSRERDRSKHKPKPTNERPVITGIKCFTNISFQKNIQYCHLKNMTSFLKFAGSRKTASHCGLSPMIL